MNDLNFSKRSGRKNLSEKELRKHCVSVRLNEEELRILDGGKGKFQRGEALRMLALTSMPRPVPLQNEKTVYELSRSLGNLATVAKFLRDGTPDKTLIEDSIYQVKCLMKVLLKGESVNEKI